MATLQVQRLSIAFADRQLLDDISFTLSERARAALVGANGSGKSTLLQIVAGLMSADIYEYAQPKDMRISYLPQSDIVLEEGTAYEQVELAYDRFLPLVDEQHAIEERLARGELSDYLLQRLHEIQEALLGEGYHDRKTEIAIILKGLGFHDGDLHRPCSEFSGGWQMRIALAKVLAEKPHLLLLDEPTNYLDIEARYWLKNYLRVYPESVMIVSHDRSFLDETINEVFELFQGQLKRYKGTYSQYEKQRENEIQSLIHAYEQQREEIRKQEVFIERFRAKASKARQVQGRIKQLERLEIIEIPEHLRNLSFSFPPAPHSGKQVLKIEDLTKRYGSLTVFEHFDSIVMKGERIAVVGKNGTGKSTLLRILAGIDTDYRGKLTVGSGVQIGYFAQDAKQTLDDSNTVLEELGSVASTADIPRLRTYLGSFLFSGDDVFKRVGILSGGERSRLALLKTLMHPANLLILDEPTSHLDISAKNALLQAIKEYDGTLIFVSHDAHVIQEAATSILYLTEENPPELFKGDWSYFSYRLEQKEAVAVETPKEEKKPARSYRVEKQKHNRLVSLRRQAEASLVRHDTIETELKEVQRSMSQSENYSVEEKIVKLVNEEERLRKKLAKEEASWLALEEERMKLEEELYG
ncbi:MAG TPA: ABC-F family ATP-binding cassette domain-containing protein [Sphaerochaeta sp.]|nr:ABC-F family ATP-binding cassette domain-containing protein [Sphaerochaeta sp.]